jgi:4,5-DOPA dioxygenase extradiol
MKRSTFIKTISIFPFLHTSMNLEQLRSMADAFAPTDLMPILFIGHGNPMNALLDNSFTRQLAQTGVTICKNYKPNVILVVSAHWLTKGTYVCASPKPETIHDFGGFPDELFAVQYPALGSPEFAAKTAELAPEIQITNEWGLDHGAWTILKHLVPSADIPVFQVSIDYHRPMQYHIDLAKQLQSLRRKGVLIIGSGNIVHNLRLSMGNLHNDSNKPFDWAIEFDEWIKNRLNDRDFQAVVNYEKQGTAAKLSVPTVDHYVPMLYSIGLAGVNEELHHFYEEIAFGGISMRCFQVG